MDGVEEYHPYMRASWALPIVLVIGLLAAPSAQAGWLAPIELSEAGEHAGAPHLVLDAAGNATAVWDRWNGSDTVVETAYRPAGEAWQAPTDLSEEAEEAEALAGAHDASAPQIAVDGAGDVTVVWERYEGANDLLVQADYRPAGGSWETPVTISGPSGTMADLEPKVAVDARGDATALWMRAGTIQTAYKPANGSWQAPQDLSGSESLTPVMAVDSQGDATAVWMHFDGSRYVVQTAFRPTGEAWQAPSTLSQNGEEGGNPYIALDAHGDTMVVWTGHPEETSVVRVAYRPAGEAWQAPITLPGEEHEAQGPRVALDPHGDAIVAWESSSKNIGSYTRVRASYRPAGGSWETPTTLSQDGANAYPSRAAFDQAGNAVLMWERSDGTEDVVQADYRPAGAESEWEAPASLSAEGQRSSEADVVLDAEGEAPAAQGDATAIWITNGGTCEKSGGEITSCGSYAVQAAGYDSVEPPAEGFAAPPEGVVGTPVTFAVSPTDVWSPKLSFGDGTSAAATNATHTYTRPGRYMVTFASTEILGYSSSMRRPITIVAKAEAESTEATGSHAAGDQIATGPGPAAALQGSALPEPAPPLKLRLTVRRQTLRDILRARAIHLSCHLNAPGVCIVRTVLGSGHTVLRAPGSAGITIRLTHPQMRAVRRLGVLRLVLRASATGPDRQTATAQITLLAR
jgi:hypothetical protein